MVKVVAAVIEQDGRILICRRRNKDGSAGKWEFPGGKQELGETEQECLVRELREELCLVVRPGKNRDRPPRLRRFSRSKSRFTGRRRFAGK